MGIPQKAAGAAKRHIQKRSHRGCDEEVHGTPEVISSDLLQWVTISCLVLPKSLGNQD